MPTPTIPDGELFFNATTYTGNGSTQTITNGNPGQSFQPDLVWIKNRSGANSHQLTNSVMGVTKYLFSDATLAEETRTTQVTAITSTGFSLGSAAAVNTSGNSFVAWQWKAGGTAVTNTAGTISSQVSANTTSGFSVVTYTGTGSAATVGHGLGVAPSMIIAKSRSTVANWQVYHSSISNMATGFIMINSTAAFSTATSQIWNSTAPTSTVFSLGTDTDINGSANTIVAYCWTPIAGYSAFGSYTGNGSADGPFIYTGFRPKFFMTKITSAAGYDWIITDTSRDTYNVSGLCLEANLSNAESTNGGAFSSQSDILSNGFKIRNSGTGANGSGGTYIYMAFAENPFKYANAR